MIFVLIINWENICLVTTDLSLLIENINKLEDTNHCCIEFWDNRLIDSLNYDKKNINLDNIYIDIMKTIDSINKNNTIKHDITTVEYDDKNKIIVIDECYRNKRDGTKILVNKYEFSLLINNDFSEEFIFLTLDQKCINFSINQLNNLLNEYNAFNNAFDDKLSKEAFVEIYKNVGKLFMKVKSENFLKE